MNKAPAFVAFSAVVLFAGLYFGFGTKPAKQHVIERSRSINKESTSLDNLLEEARTQLNEEQTTKVSDALKRLESASSEADQAEALKSLSSLWYSFGHLPVAGAYAEKVAELENTAAAWSVSGATFFNGMMTAQDPTVRQFCADHAIKGFEGAASLEPDQPEHRVNLALIYAENPPADNPMKAVMMLRELETKHPESVAVYNALGRLAIKTGQWQKAIDRLEKAWSLDKKNPNTPCLLAQAYEGIGDDNKATEFASRCKGN